MSSASFELVLDGAIINSRSAKKAILDILATECGFQGHELESLLLQGPLTVSKSSKREDLEALFHTLKDAGAQVEITPSGSDLSVPTNIPDDTAVETLPGATEVDSCRLRAFYDGYIRDLSRIMASLAIEEVTSLVQDLLRARAKKSRIFIIGNGGSAANASHLANDLSKQRFEDDSLLFRVFSLTDNVPWLTAIANDSGYEMVFVNQLKNLMHTGDLLLAISSSGNSANVIRAIDYANAGGVITYGIVGFTGGELRTRAKKSIYIPTEIGQYGYMEDATLILGHLITAFLWEHDQEILHIAKAR